MPTNEPAIPDAYALVPAEQYRRMVAVLRAVATNRYDEHRCPFCYGASDVDARVERVHHFPGCPVTTARALVAEMGEDA